MSHIAIRQAVRTVEEARPDTEQWWQAVQVAQEHNAEHMTHEEREFITSFKAAVPAYRRDELGLQWLAFHDEHESANRLDGDDADPVQVATADVPDPSHLDPAAND